MAKRFFVLRLVLLALACLTLVQAAHAMSQSAIPPKFPIPWGASAGSAYIRSIPTTSQTGCAASLPDGFPPLTFVPSTAGGCPPFGQDFNGILNQITLWSQWQGAGAPVVYDSAFSASIGGYPNGTVLAVVGYPGCFWISTVNANASDPDTGGSNWTLSCPGGGVGGTSTSSANAQVVAATPFKLVVGSQVSFVAGFTNTGPLRINVNSAGLVNVFRRSQLGATMSVGGEVIAGQTVVVQWDGTEWQCLSCEAVHVGTIEDYAGASAPPGTMLLDGSCVSQTTYADLYSILGTNYGSCSAGQFALPDLRGRVASGADTFGTGAGAASRLTSAGSGCAATAPGVGCGGQNVTIAQAGLPNITVNYSRFIPNPSGDFNFQSSITPVGGVDQVIQGTPGPSTQPTTSINGGVTQTTTRTIMPLQTVSKIIRY